MILLITMKEWNESKQKYEVVVDYGVDVLTDKIVCVDNLPLSYYTEAKWSEDYQEWYI